MPVAEDYYALLGVLPEADGAAIRAAYRALMRRYHPDVNPSDDAAAQAKAINEAYACLRDADRRAAYDWQRNARTRRARAARSSRSGVAPARPAPPRPAWTGPHAPPEPSPPWYHPSWNKAIGLGVAALITAITFTLTSSVPPVAAAVAKGGKPLPVTGAISGAGSVPGRAARARS